MKKKFWLAHFSPHREGHQELFDKFNFQNEGALFFNNVAQTFGYNSYVPRDGIWTTPWDGYLEIEPNNTMPDFIDFRKSFSQVCDDTAQIVANDIDQNDEQYVIFYSGGMDSTCALTSLIKNLTDEQKQNITVSMSSDSVMENFRFYRDFIKGKFRIEDSSKNYDMTDRTQKMIVSDQGDAVFGTELGTKFYPMIETFYPKTNMRKYVSNEMFHFSEYEDAIIEYLNMCFKKQEKTSFDLEFGRMYYEKLVINIESSKVPIISLHDFFWWIIFNIKYMHCALRPAGIHSTGGNRKQAFDRTFNFFGTQDFQLWSMNNNNNGEKIYGLTQSDYKHAIKKYIFDLDGNEFTFKYKTKISSKQHIINRTSEVKQKTFGLDTDYNMVMFDDEMEQFFEHQLKNFNWR